MPRILRLALSGEQRTELEDARDHHGQAHMREKAAALLKIADGQIALHVAQRGLLKERDADTIYRWLRVYEKEGLAGLAIRPGRGRKASFSPSVRD